METQTIIQTAESSLLHTYNRFPIVLDHGEDVYLYDTDQKKYLDFAAGIAVFALGYSNDAYKTAVKEQVDKLVHTSNLFYNEPAAKAAKKITQLTGMDRVFFTNSGTEAIEGAIKLVRKYAYNKDGRTDHEIIAMKHSFHGRSMGALSVTGNDAYQAPFKPLIGGVRFAEYNNLESVKSLITDRTFREKAEFTRHQRNLCRDFVPSAMSMIFYLSAMKFSVEWDVLEICSVIRAMISCQMLSV